MKIRVSTNRLLPDFPYRTVDPCLELRISREAYCFVLARSAKIYWPAKIHSRDSQFSTEPRQTWPHSFAPPSQERPVRISSRDHHYSLSSRAITNTPRRTLTVRHWIRHSRYFFVRETHFEAKRRRSLMPAITRDATQFAQLSWGSTGESARGTRRQLHSVLLRDDRTDKRDERVSLRDYRPRFEPIVVAYVLINVSSGNLSALATTSRTRRLVSAERKTRGLEIRSDVVSRSTDVR